MALSADVIYESASDQIQSVPAVNGDVLYAGALIAIDSAGYAAPWADTTNYNFIGVCMKQVIRLPAQFPKRRSIRVE